MFTEKKFLGDEDIETGDIETKLTAVEAPSRKIAGGENNNGDPVETEKWASSLATKLDDVPQYMCSPGHPGRISRIPQNLREVDCPAYEPCFLSLGPYHHGKPSLQKMEKRKWAVLKYFIEQNPRLTLKDFLIELRGIEPEARNFYSDVNMDSQTFLQMLLLDSLFVLLIFCGMPVSRQAGVENVHTNENVIQINNDIRTGSDTMNTEFVARKEELMEETPSRENTEDGQRLVWTMLPHDLFLLENQLPFCVLQKIHLLAYSGTKTPLIAVMKGKIAMLLSDYVKLDSEMIIPETEQVHHILHLCHMFFRPKIQNLPATPQFSESRQMFRLGSAVQLYEAGVCFEATSGSIQHSLLDITFSASGKMTMPYLHVDDRINSLLRNLIALEQMKYPNLGLDICAYIVLLLHLITAPGDVLLLRRKGIIQHHLPSDKEMMRFVNRLSVGLSFDYVEDNYSLKPVFQELKKYSERRRPRWRAWMEHRYFNNPWMTISLVAAFLLLILSIIQTYYTVYSYYHPFFDGHS